MVRITLIAALLCAVTTANAAVYKCTGPDDALTFSDKPCDGQPSEEVDVRDTGPASSPRPSYDPLEGQRRMAEEYDRRHDAEIKANIDRRRGAVLDKKARDEWANKLRDAKMSDRVIKGMPADDVRDVLGSPDKVNPSSGGREQWVYYESSGTDYVHLQNGKVTSWSRYNR